MPDFSRDQERQSFRSLFNVFEVVRDQDSDMSISQATVFFWVCLNEGRTQADLRQSLGMPSSTASRSLAALSKMHRLGKEGLDLIEWVECATDRRQKELYLTRKGTALRNRLVSLV